MFRYLVAIMAAIIILSFSYSCEKDNLPSLSEDDHSGYGYASVFYDGASEALFVIESDETKDVDLNIRCECSFDYDRNSCILVNEGSSYPIEIQKTGQWTSVSLRLTLKQGENRLGIMAAKPMKSYVLIDYIEYQ
jgi:hypothetical protein